MKKILVPTDFSESSSAAYGYAALLAESSGATICLLHVLDISSASLSADGKGETLEDTHFMMEMMKLTKARMAKVSNSRFFADDDVEEVIETGPVPAMILKAAKKYKADMIVMGTHGNNGLQERFIGTNAEKVVRDADIPVLTIKYPLKGKPAGTMMFATDFSNEAAEVLPAVNRLAKTLNTRLVLTKVVTLSDFETTEQTESLVEQFRQKNEVFEFSTAVYYAHSREEGIRQAAASQGADIIALGTHGRHGLARLFAGSTAEAVVGHATLPVLTINFQKMKTARSSQNVGRKQRSNESVFTYQIPSV